MKCWASEVYGQIGQVPLFDRRPVNLCSRLERPILWRGEFIQKDGKGETEPRLRLVIQIGEDHFHSIGAGDGIEMMSFGSLQNHRAFLRGL